MNDKPVENLLTGPKNPVELALLEADKKLKKDRSKRIGELLDKAVAVVSNVLDTDNVEGESMRMRAAELTIGLYTAEQTAERADRQLDIQAKRLEIEERKVGINTLLLQQNIYNGDTGREVEKNLVQQDDGSVVDVNLLARKKAQQMILDAQLDIVKEMETTEEED